MTTPITKVDFVTIPTKDLDAAMRFYGEAFDTGVCYMAFFSDADGNPLMLHSRYAPRS